MLIQEPSAYFEQWLAREASGPGDRLLVVLDPERYLDLPDELTVGGRAWRVYRHAENDLDFRAAYGHGPADPNLPHIIWVTPSPFHRARPDTLDLSYIPDVLRRADHILDLSLTGLLRALLPDEVFPEAGLHAYGDILSRRLDTLLVACRELRRQIGRKPALDIHHLRALALHCLQPDIPLGDLLFTETHPRDVLGHYLRLAWSRRLEGQSLSLWQEHVASSPPIPVEELRPWFQAPPDDLALLVYVYRALRSYGVPNPLNQLKGLNLAATDPAPLAPYLDAALGLWADEALRLALIQRAETALDPARLAELVDLLPLLDAPALIHALRRETAPALVCGLATRLLDRTRESVPADVSAAPAGVETPYVSRAQAALATIRELGFIQGLLQQPLAPAPDLATLTDWYVESGAYRLELACARAEEQGQQLTRPERQTGQAFQAYLAQLRQRVWDYLAPADANLADLVGRDYPAFLDHPRLSVRVLRDAVLAAGFRPTPERSLWVLVFDGMRWDSWREVVWPALAQHFEVVAEGKAYLSLLPSFTGVARTGLLAGAPPSGWRAAKGRHTSNEELLIARLFDLDPAGRDRWLRVEVIASGVSSEQRPLGGDIDRRPINVLIYDVSDDWVHRFQGHLAALNGVIARQMQTVVEDLLRQVREGDRVVVTSDHGFVELDLAASIPVGGGEPDAAGPANERVFYRYLVNQEHAEGLRVPGHGDAFYTVARGRAWFQRAGGRFTRYSHGGVSLGEMVVPGVVVRRIVTPWIKLELAGLPRRLDVLEKEPQTIRVTLRNAGNQRTAYTLTVATNTDPAGQTFPGALGPGEAHDLAYTFAPTYSPRRTDRLTVRVTYADVDGREKRLPARSVSIVTAPRRDVVELGFGGLDQLDEL